MSCYHVRLLRRSCSDVSQKQTERGYENEGGRERILTIGYLYLARPTVIRNIAVIILANRAGHPHHDASYTLSIWSCEEAQHFKPEYFMSLSSWRIGYHKEGRAGAWKF